MRKLYIARRISESRHDDVDLHVQPSDSITDLKARYAMKSVERSGYIHYGHWVLRAAGPDEILADNNLPESLSPADVLDMVVDKLSDADAVVAFVNELSFGTIAELGLAVGRRNLAVYVLPEHGLDPSIWPDFWMCFYLALRTRPHWRAVDIEALPEFGSHGINTLEDYRDFVTRIVPQFMKR